MALMDEVVLGVGVLEAGIFLDEGAL